MMLEPQQRPFYSCGICDKFFPTKETLNSHNSQVHLEVPGLQDVSKEKEQTESNIEKNFDGGGNDEDADLGENEDVLEFLNNTEPFEKDEDMEVQENGIGKNNTEPFEKEEDMEVEENGIEKSFVKTEHTSLEKSFVKTEDTSDNTEAIEGQYVCKSCGMEYTTKKGIEHHLRKTPCGFKTSESNEVQYYESSANIKSEKDSTMNTSSREEFQQFYEKLAPNKFVCNSCKNEYQSNHGIRYHLKTTRCGTGPEDSPPPKPRRDWFGMYRKEEDSSGNCTYVCKTCESSYISQHGVHYHLKRTGCGVGTKDPGPAPIKKDWNYMYTRKDNGAISCNKCETMYNSLNGVYTHLKTTVCGFGDKVRREPKMDWSSFYTKTDDMISCLSCSSTFNHLHSIHRHLKATACGAEASKKQFVPDTRNSPSRTKKDYLSFYTRVGDDNFICNTCGALYLSTHGMHYHLNSTTCGFGSMSPSLVAKNSFMNLYLKLETGECICQGCGAKYETQTGVYHHLRRTECGGDLGNLPQVAHEKKETSPGKEKIPRIEKIPRKEKSPRKQLQCFTCEFKTSSKTSLKSHEANCETKKLHFS